MESIGIGIQDRHHFMDGTYDRPSYIVLSNTLRISLRLRKAIPFELYTRIKEGLSQPKVDDIDLIIHCDTCDLSLNHP
jgi:hypothetical protein